MLWCLMSAALAGAPWVRRPGELYSKASLQRFAPTLGQTPPQTVADATSESWTALVYAEVGVAPHVQLAASLPWVASHSDVATARYTNRSGGDAILDVTYGRALTSGLPGALTLRTKWPTYSRARIGSLGTAGRRFVPAGDGQVDLELLGHLGSGVTMADRHGWWMFETGYRHRTEWWIGPPPSVPQGFGDCVTARAQLGWTPRQGDRNLGWLFVESDGVRAVTRSATPREHLQLSIGAAQQVGRRAAVEIGASHLVWTSGADRGTAVRLGMSWQRSPPDGGSEDMQAE